MSSILTKATVLVLNRNWQAINVRTPQEAFCMMATNVATGLEIERGDGARAEALRPVSWEEWITLPIRERVEIQLDNPNATLVEEERIAEVEGKLQDSYYTDTLKIRAYQDSSKAYFRASVFKDLFPNRTPEFKGKKSG